MLFLFTISVDETIDVNIAEPTVVNVPIGETVRFECLTNSEVRNVSVKYSHNK